MSRIAWKLLIKFSPGEAGAELVYSDWIRGKTHSRRITMQKAQSIVGRLFSLAVRNERFTFRPNGQVWEGSMREKVTTEELINLRLGAIEKQRAIMAQCRLKIGSFEQQIQRFKNEPPSD